MIPASSSPHSQTGGDGEAPKIPVEQGENAAATSRLAMELAGCAGWQKLALPIIRVRMAEMEALILDEPTLTDHALTLLRAQRWELKGFLRKLDEVAAQSQRILEASKDNTGTPKPARPITTDMPIDPAFLKAMGAQPLGPSLQEEVNAHFNPFAPSKP